MHKFMQKYGVKIEELILVLLIILNIMDFLEKIPSEIDYIKKVISWTVLAYMLYKADLTNIFFGHSHRTMDLMLILSYFMLIIKDFTAYALAEIQHSTLLREFYTFVIVNASMIEKIGFYVGGIMLILIAFYYAARHEIRKPSLMHVIHEEGKPPKNPIKLLVRGVIILMVLVAFFVIVFNLMMEWLAIAIDAPIIILALFFYIFHAKRFNPETLIYQIAEGGEKFYEKFVEMFQYKRSILMGIVGMLVLHIATDIGTFIVPYVFAVADPLYFSQLGASTHQPLWALFQQSIPGLTEQQIAGLAAMYILNTAALVFLLVMPIYFWYELYKGKHIAFKEHWIALFATAVVVLIQKPIFGFGQITQKNLAGVDITSNIISISGMWQVLKLAAIVGIGVFVLSFFLRKLLEILMMVVIQGVFGYYVYLYFINLTGYFIDSIIILLGTPHKFIAVFLFLFFMMTIIFYVGGFFIFLISTVKSYFKI